VRSPRYPIAVDTPASSAAELPLLEREHVLASLGEYLAAARTRDGRLVLVAGEAGVGKSTLIEQFEAAAPTARWAHGACDGLFTPRPLGPLFDIAAELGGELLDACRRGAARDVLFTLLLESLTACEAGTVLVIEDVHWADESTLDVLRFLGRRLRDLPVLVIATYRDDELLPTHPLRLVLGELACQRSTRRIDLSPLSEQAVGALATGSGLDAAQLHRLTGGNPFFVTEVLQDRSGDVPPSARDAILARVARLPESARRVVEAAALIGTHLERPLLDAVAGPSAADLDALLDAGVLVSDPAGLRFRHEITRLAVERELPAHRCRPIHAAVLAALDGVPGVDEARLAHHAEGAEDAGAVLRCAPNAAQRASALGAHREAVAQYERAVRFATGADEAVAADLLDRLAGEYSLIDRFEQAAVVREQALAHWRAVGDRRRVGETLRQQSRTMWRLCRGADAVALSEQAVATLEPLGPTPELAAAYAGHSMMAQVQGELDLCLALAARAQQLADQLGLPTVLSDALNNEAYGLAAAGREWQPTMKQAAQVAMDVGAVEQVARAYANSQELLVEQMRIPEALQNYPAALAYCDERDMSTFATCLAGHYAHALEHVGRWDEAVTICAAKLAMPASPVNRLNHLCIVGRVAARRGEDGFWDLLEEARSHAVTTEEALWVLPARLACAEARWLAGTPELAHEELAAAEPYLRRSSPWMRGAFGGWVRRTGAPIAVPDDDLPRPYALAAQRRFDGAVAEWDRLGCGYAAALTLFDSGTGDGLRDALRRFEALGAVAAVEATRREMRRRGLRAVPARPRPSTRAHPAGLTRRESEVLDLICAGRTNSEISEQLYISERTVDHHVSAVLAKLGVASRTVAVVEAARLGLVSVAGT
jgi:DNA-binding CsgD family transcriptional regulator/tetratricopeptide (TPR) repeat protein